MSVAVETLVEETTGETGTDVDVVAATIKVNGDPAVLLTRLNEALAKDRDVRSIITKHRGALMRLTNHFGSRDKALRLIALGVHAGAWTVQSAVELLNQPRAKAEEMTKSGFLYVKTV